MSDPAILANIEASAMRCEEGFFFLENAMKLTSEMRPDFASAINRIRQIHNDLKELAKMDL